MKIELNGTPEELWRYGTGTPDEPCNDDHDIITLPEGQEYKVFGETEITLEGDPIRPAFPVDVRLALLTQLQRLDRLAGIVDKGSYDCFVAADAQKAITDAMCELTRELWG